MIKYTIINRKTLKPLTVYTKENEGYACVPLQHLLSENAEQIWLVDDMDVAQRALEFSTHWYAANYETPTHVIHITKETHAVAKVTIEIV